MYAIRNIRLCTKDCVCLFVCPTGATDTETGQIDSDKCLDGCRRCVDACPSHAISLVLDKYPARLPKPGDLAEALLAFMDRKRAEEAIAGKVAKESGKKGEQRLARALAMSLRIAAEDGAREAGYLFPQGESSKEFLESLLAERKAIEGKEFPESVIRELLASL